MRREVKVTIADAGLDTEGPVAIDMGDGSSFRVIRILYVCNAIGNAKGRRFTVILNDNKEHYVYKIGQKWYMDM